MTRRLLPLRGTSELNWDEEPAPGPTLLRSAIIWENKHNNWGKERPIAFILLWVIHLSSTLISVCWLGSFTRRRTAHTKTHTADLFPWFIFPQDGGEAASDETGQMIGYWGSFLINIHEPDNKYVASDWICPYERECLRCELFLTLEQICFRLLATVSAGLSHWNTWHFNTRVFLSRATYAKSLKRQQHGMSKARIRVSFIIQICRYEHNKCLLWFYCRILW